MSVKIMRVFALVMILIAASSCEGPTGSSTDKTPHATRFYLTSTPVLIATKPPPTLPPTMAPLQYYYKGQLHVHSNAPTIIGINTDTPAAQSPDVVEKWYRDLGYTFVALTDHNTTTSDPMVSCDQSSPPRCVLHINGQEDGWACAHHLLAIGDKGSGEINPGECCDYLERSPTDNLKKRDCLISRTNDAKKRADIVFLGMHKLIGASPSPHDYTWTTEEIQQIGGYATGMEVFNGGDSFEDRWERRLGYRAAFWGFGTDDCEDLVDGVDLGSCNRSWIVVPSSIGPVVNYIASGKQDDLRQGILRNIREGKFYFVIRSPGRTPDSIGRNDIGPRLEVKMQGQKILVNTEEPGSDIKSKSITFLGHCGEGVKSVADAHRAEYDVTGRELYVRIVVEQERFGELHRAYSQPFFPDLTSGVEGEVHACGLNGISYLTVYFGCGINLTYKTDVEGKFRISKLPKGNLAIVVTRQGFKDTPVTVELVKDGFTDIGTIKMEPIGQGCP